MTKTTFGVIYSDSGDTRTVEAPSLAEAYGTARTLVEREQCDADIVELEGSGPCYDSDGIQIAETHAPRRTLETVRAVMTYYVVRRTQHQVGGINGGPNAYMALVAVPAGAPSPAERYLSGRNVARYGWRILARREYYEDSRLVHAGSRVVRELLRKLPPGVALSR